MKCAECGSPGIEASCTDRFHHFLALEFSDPVYEAVHHLTVTTYMLQHPSQLSAKGWEAIYETLHGFLILGLSPNDLRAGKHHIKAHGPLRTRCSIH